MSEFESFMTSLADKSQATKNAYRIQYNKLKKLLEHDVADVSQKKVLQIVDEQGNPHQKQSLINIAILVRRLNNLKTDELIKQRDKNKKGIEDRTKEVNASLDLPSLNELEEYVDYLFEKGKWTDYIINYLLLELQVRNKDVNFKIVTRKKDMTDANKNYIWLDVRQKKAVYVRRDYKTSKTYGEKRHTITDKKFITALKRVLACQKHDEECGVFIKNEDHVGYYVQKSTYKNIGEGAYLKIIINAHRNGGNTQKLTEIADNRGTDTSTLLQSYDVSKV
jgi:hypothetical protein